MKRIMLSFSRFRDADFEAKSKHIVHSLKGNPAFAQLADLVDAIENDTEAYSDALANCGSNMPSSNTVLKKQQRKKLEVKLHNLGRKLEDAAAGDELMLATSGFDFAKKSTPVGLMEKAKNLQVAPGPNKGTLTISVKAVPRASFYEFMVGEIAADGGTAWQTYPSLKRKTTITGLKSGKEYRMKAAACGTETTRVWSDEITSFVL